MARKGNISCLQFMFANVTIILIFFCIAEITADACLRYGHACWGGHGKRSGNENRNESPLRPELVHVVNKDPLNGKWFLSKVIRGPFDLKDVLIRDLLANQRGGGGGGGERQVFEPDNFKGSDDNLFDDESEIETAPIRLNKRKVSKLMDKRSILLN